MDQTDPRRMLGAFIRAHRERLPLPPEKVGTRRRTPGLRREELADAAGLSATWITWLEQGREVNASSQALSRLAEALRLSSAERASLFDLAGRRDPVAPASADDVLSGVLGLPSLLAVPAYLLDHNWTARAWNEAAADLFVGWLDEAAEDRNLLGFVFLCPGAKTLIRDWPERARRLVAEFRADFNRRPRDPAMQELVDDLSRRSPLFAKHWRDQDVLGREGGERRFDHPEHGQLAFRQTTLLVAAQQDIKLVCLIPDLS